MIVADLILPSLVFWLCLHIVRYLFGSQKGVSTLPLTTRSRPAPLHRSHLLQWVARIKSETSFDLRDVRLDISTTIFNNPLELLSSRLRPRGILRSTLGTIYNVGAVIGALVTIICPFFLLWLVWTILPNDFTPQAPYSTMVKRSTIPEPSPPNSRTHSLQLVVRPFLITCR